MPSCRDTSNRYFEESSESDSGKKSSANSKKSVFDRRKSQDGVQKQKALELSDPGNLSKSMSNDYKNGFLEVGIHQKHDILACNSKKEEHSITDMRNPE